MSWIVSLVVNKKINKKVLVMEKDVLALMNVSHSLLELKV